MHRDERNDITERSNSRHPLLFVRPAPLPPSLPLCLTSLLATFEVPPLRVQNAVSREQLGGKGRKRETPPQQLQRPFLGLWEGGGYL